MANTSMRPIQGKCPNRLFHSTEKCGKNTTLRRNHLVAKKAKAPVPTHEMWSKGTDPDELIIPGGNQATLSTALAEQFQSLSRKSREALIAMCLLANAVRTANKDQSGNYNKSFHEWYSKHNMDKVFGSKSNFSRYADAGVVVAKHKAVLGKELSQLPLSVAALCEIHDMTDEEIELCWNDTYKRATLLAPKEEWTTKSKTKKEPVINAHATAASIKSWKKAWRSPPVEKADKRNLPFITIFADYSIYDIDKHGTLNGNTTIEDLEKINSSIKTILAGKDSQVRFESKMDSIKDSQQKRIEAARIASEKRIQKAAAKLAKLNKKKAEL
jgi:hypothetical protein